ncbi:hypothetical protein [Rhodococcus sp. 24CO]|uniref:hypothetical protein n=1 Tax=Rhodococcus sp. 24CO TaxID=3117460 RepID=UPI003D3473AF
MIIAVEGPSAAGKTTWCRANHRAFVAEYTPTGQEPDGSDAMEQATYWARVNAHRWTQSLALERVAGDAICDSDPLKLHYSWSLAAVVVLSIPDIQRLVTQRDGDSTRRRRSFELHARLAEPLAEWYSAVDRLDPGRVIHGFPTEVDFAALAQPRPDRYDVNLLDRLLDVLPAQAH